MQYKIPGTVIFKDENFKGNAFSLIEPIFSLTGGLTLAQVRDITGLETSTIQNWVRRGWVPQPVNKRYLKKSLLRILLINSIRGALQIEKIAALMRYINGDVEDTSDDIISDEDLFNIFCKIIFEITVSTFVLRSEIEKIISDNLVYYEEREHGTKHRLKTALYVMTMAYIAAELKNLSNRVFDENIPVQ